MKNYISLFSALFLIANVIWSSPNTMAGNVPAYINETSETKVITVQSLSHLRLYEVRDDYFLVYEEGESKALFIVHELSDENSSKKIRVARKQLSDTLNQLYQSEAIGNFIEGFNQKLCFLSAKDCRRIVSSEGMADGFNEIYRILSASVKTAKAGLKIED